MAGRIFSTSTPGASKEEPAGTRIVCSTPRAEKCRIEEPYSLLTQNEPSCARTRPSLSRPYGSFGSTLPLTSTGRSAVSAAGGRPVRKRVPVIGSCWPLGTRSGICLRMSTEPSLRSLILMICGV